MCITKLILADHLPECKWVPGAYIGPNEPVLIAPSREECLQAALKSYPLLENISWNADSQFCLTKQLSAVSAPTLDSSDAYTSFQSLTASGCELVLAPNGGEGSSDAYMILAVIVGSLLVFCYLLCALLQRWKKTLVDGSDGCDRPAGLKPEQKKDSSESEDDDLEAQGADLPLGSQESSYSGQEDAFL